MEPTTLATSRMKATVLVIDDDVKLTRLLNEYLAGFGYKVLVANHPDEGFWAIRREDPEVIILDVMLPDMDGFEVCRKIRREHTTPIIMLTARGEVTDRVVGLELGADDYLSKPFEPRELVARIQAVLRRGGTSTKKEIARIGPLHVDFRTHTVKLADLLISLTTAEFNLLKLFVERRGRVLSRDYLVEQMRGMEWEAFDRSVDVLVSRVRQKLNDDPRNPRFIRTVRGAGYLFIGEEAHDE